MVFVRQRERGSDEKRQFESASSRQPVCDFHTEGTGEAREGEKNPQLYDGASGARAAGGNRSDKLT